MRVAIVRWHQSEVCENLIIESIEDVFAYQEHLAKNTSDTFSKVVKARIPNTCWDHYGHEGEYGNSFNMAVQKCKILGGRPIMEFDKITNEKCIAILGCIQKGMKVLINKVGGWCYLHSDYHEVLGYKEYVPSSERKAVINENTQYINLENDPTLEKRSIEYLSSVDENYSYVLRLIEYSDEELAIVFKQFIAFGGHTVYVYTTGSNVNQMWDYSRAIIKSGLKNIVFEFNAGMNGQIAEVINFLKDSSITVGLVGETL